MLKPEVLAVLCCPEDHSRLTPASQSLVAELNNLIRRRQLRNRAGRLLERTIDGALTTTDGERGYPIIDGIPVLVRDEAIFLRQLNDGMQRK